MGKCYRHALSQKLLGFGPCTLGVATGRGPYEWTLTRHPRRLLQAFVWSLTGRLFGIDNIEGFTQVWSSWPKETHDSVAWLPHGFVFLYQRSRLDKAYASYVFTWATTCPPELTLYRHPHRTPSTFLFFEGYLTLSPGAPSRRFTIPHPELGNGVTFVCMGAHGGRALTCNVPAHDPCITCFMIGDVHCMG
ncbi:hypothetical protein VNO77_08580 [Canavalia gladiata]|uniref:Uncharacterized protein n=1 Tax=Canavalia gladiata TaxID=3824 RepID=A0AAN9QWN2_CANGL